MEINDKKDELLKMVIDYYEFPKFNEFDKMDQMALSNVFLTLTLHLALFRLHLRISQKISFIPTN